jgi:hypothetical protein
VLLGRALRALELLRVLRQLVRLGVQRRDLFGHRDRALHVSAQARDLAEIVLAVVGLRFLEDLAELVLLGAERLTSLLRIQILDVHGASPSWKNRVPAGGREQLGRYAGEGR